MDELQHLEGKMQQTTKNMFSYQHPHFQFNWTDMLIKIIETETLVNSQLLGQTNPAPWVCRPGHKDRLQPQNSSFSLSLKILFSRKKKTNTQIWTVLPKFKIFRSSVVCLPDYKKINSPSQKFIQSETVRTGRAGYLLERASSDDSKLCL